MFEVFIKILKSGERRFPFSSIFFLFHLSDWDFCHFSTPGPKKVVSFVKIWFFLNLKSFWRLPGPKKSTISSFLLFLASNQIIERLCEVLTHQSHSLSSRLKSSTQNYKNWLRHVKSDLLFQVSSFNDFSDFSVFSVFDLLSYSLKRV